MKCQFVKGTVIGAHEMQEITLKRKIYTELQKWKKEYSQEYALYY